MNQRLHNLKYPVMELTNGKCTLCHDTRKVFASNTESYAKQIQYAFFEKNKDDCPQEEFIASLAFCIICCNKLQVSFDFKKSYDRMCNKGNGLHKNKCFFCETKAGALVDVNDAMQDFNKKLEVFLNSVIVHHNYEGLSACIRCMYDLSIWWEVRACIYSLMNLPVNVPTPETNVSNNVCSTPTINRSMRKDCATKNSARSKRYTRLSTLKGKGKEHGWTTYLNKRLEYVRTADEIIKCDGLSFNDVDASFSDKLNDKLFSKKAYVSVSINSQISANVLQRSNAYETIVINDSEDEGISSPTPHAPLNENSKNVGTPSQNKTPFKIKFSSSFSRSLTLRNKYTYTCAVCDKGFFVRCDYLAHLLRHDKVESVIINVTRYDLPAQVKAHEFENLHRNKTKRFSLPIESINQLLVKWVGKHAAGTFDESDGENGRTKKVNVKETELAVEEDSGHEEGNVIKEGEPSKNDVDLNNSKNIAETSDENRLEVAADGQTPEEVKEKPGDSQTLEDVKGKPDDSKTSEDAKGKPDDGQTPEDAKGKPDDSKTPEDPKGKPDDGQTTEDAKGKPDDSQTPEEVKEKTDEMIASNETDAPENLEAIEIENSEGNNSDVHSQNKSDENENQRTETERKNDESCVVNEPIVVSENGENVDAQRNDETKSANEKAPSDPEEFSSDESNVSSGAAKLVSCEELLRILEDEDNCGAKKKTTANPGGESSDKDVENGDRVENVSGDEVNENVESNGGTKRKREDESDETPKRKRVRFASEKVIMTPDKSILLEKVSDSDDVALAND